MPRQSALTRLGLCIFFTALITMFVLQYSFRHGRLIALPSYDDIGYFNDGADRLQDLYDAGIPALYQSYLHNPPHSPFETAMTMIAFATLGWHDWAPYVLNGFLALGYFLFADRLLKGLATWQKVLCLGFVATVPLVGMCVHEFRPDHAVALFTSIGLAMLLTRPFIYGPRRHQIAVGAWLGVSLLTKPPVFPQTLVLAGAAIFLATVSDLLGSGRPQRIGAILKAWLAVLAPMILIPLPHFWYDRHHIRHYIYEILFGTFRNSYIYHGSRHEHLVYYLTGFGGKTMLGSHLWILTSMLLASTAVIFLSGNRRDRARTIALIGVIVLAWLIPTVNQTKQHFFGLAFQTMLMFAALYAFGRVLVMQRIASVRRVAPAREFQPGRAFFKLRIASLGLIAAVLFAVWNFQWPIRNGDVNAGWQVQRRQFVNEMFEAVVSHCTFAHIDTAPFPDYSIPEDQKVKAMKPVVLFCAIGDFNPSILTFLAFERQVRMEADSPPSDKIEDFVREFETADFVFCAEPDTQLCADFLPVSRLQQQLLDMIRARPEFLQIGKWTFMKSTHSMYLFARHEFFGYTPISGLGDLEGPFPQYNLHGVRWGYGPRTQLKVSTPSKGTYDLYWRARDGLLGQTVTVRVDGQQVAQVPLEASLTVFSDTHVPLKLSAGEHVVELEYTQWAKPPDARPMAVLFQHLQISPAKPTTQPATTRETATVRLKDGGTG